MNTPTRIPSLIAFGGWFLGVATAVMADYWLLPHLLTRFGGRRIGAVLIGLLAGVAVMWVWVEFTRRVAVRLRARAEIAASGKPDRARKTPAEQMSVAMRIMIVVLALLIAGGMILGVAPQTIQTLR